MNNITDRLSRPFKGDEIHWKAQATSKDGTKALAVCYIDARAVMDRLDEVLGTAGWQDKYELLHDGSVMCMLSIWDGEKWITKSDVGGEAEQGKAANKIKSAFSDSLKRAAVKFGIGRYLYQAPSFWVGYDSQKRQLSEIPRLPPQFLPQPPRKINASELDALQDMIKSKGADTQKVCGSFGVAQLADLTIEQAERVMGVLSQRPDVKPEPEGSNAA